MSVRTRSMAALVVRALVFSLAACATAVIGSTIADARAAYPEAEEIPGVGDRRYLRAVDDAGSALFLTYTEGGETVWALTATSLDTPPYEPCA